MIPFFDMKMRHASLREEFLRAIGEIIDSGTFAGDAAVEAFENEFAAYCGSRYAVAVGSGTDALWLTMLAMGIGPGDEVITVPMTFVATVEAICQTGARPVFVDIDTRTYTMDPAALENALSSRTKAIMPVHLFGQTAAMDPIVEFARKHGLRVIEDAAQAHGAEYKSRKAGTIGDAGCFSFYPAKNLGAFGEGGAVVTADGDLASSLRMLRSHGQARKNHHVLRGWNSRLDAIQAVVLRIKLRHLDAENQTRQSHARRYDSGLGGAGAIRIPETARDCRHVHHIYAIRVGGRQRVMEMLAGKGISCAIHYPVPVHLQPAFAELGCQHGDFPVSERCAEEFLSLPMFPELTARQIDTVVEAIGEALGVCAAV
ncbi:MAG: DegT/DnrJ/EryC1/StrS family aminotransferase [Luteolibacter sp.]|jgi:dTDP-4-amino-4,6-dideoxygalactose transaminase|nr:DegT/DnrJ/EryC1/StrS family aminotransferase [Luteolibacter sp.]